MSSKDMEKSETVKEIGILLDKCRDGYVISIDGMSVNVPIKLVKKAEK